jgi:hypothetical protein
MFAFPLCRPVRGIATVSSSNARLSPLIWTKIYETYITKQLQKQFTDSEHVFHFCANKANTTHLCFIFMSCNVHKKLGETCNAQWSSHTARSSAEIVAYFSFKYLFFISLKGSGIRCSSFTFSPSCVQSEHIKQSIPDSLKLGEKLNLLHWAMIDPSCQRSVEIFQEFLELLSRKFLSPDVRCWIFLPLNMLILSKKIYRLY